LLYPKIYSSFKTTFMKTFITTSLVALSCLYGTSVYAQFTTSGNSAIADPGIDQLQFQTATGAVRTVRFNTDNYMEMYSGYSGGDGASLFLHANNSTFTDRRGAIELWSHDATGSTLAFRILNGPSGSNIFQVDKNGDAYISNELAFLPASSAVRTFRCRTGNYFEMYSGASGSDGAGFFLHSNNSTLTDRRGGIEMWSHDATGSDMAFQLFNNPSGTRLFKIKKNADVYFKDVVLQPDNGGVRTLQFNADDANSYTEIYSGDAASNGSAIIMGTANSSVGDNGGITLWAYNDLGASQSDRAFQVITNNYGGGPVDQRSHLVVRKDGKVVIGAGLNYNSISNPSLVPSGYQLYVDDGILTKKVKVAIPGTGDWSDYVFADNYKITSLPEVENYIRDNKHLPGIPSAEEVVKDGVDLGKMDAKLLQKIEELTLYVIQQQKEIEALKKKVNN
jgi:hypothetical protein